uniref:Uncharacterized protein n=3 Tax=Oryza sativa subsp. japonica TaxID=39947 RepID=Q7G2G4_ORYSJ|nr:hypothetical protein [Oryza sativa Japonica Group]AAP54427.1 Rf1 protein, mitochondrial precursor, putative [Oryza sativa Japonica Group]
MARRGRRYCRAEGTEERGTGAPVAGRWRRRRPNVFPSAALESPELRRHHADYRPWAAHMEAKPVYFASRRASGRPELQQQLVRPTPIWADWADLSLPERRPIWAVHPRRPANRTVGVLLYCQVGDPPPPAAAAAAAGMARRVTTLTRARTRARGGGVPSAQGGTTQDLGRAGGSGTEGARHVLDELPLRGWGASIYSFNRTLTDVARDSPAAAVSLFNRMARAGADEVTPDLCTYSILIGCCCRAGRLDLGFAALGNVIKKGFRVEAITFAPLLKGLCADKRTSDAMDIVLRRMTELSCMPDVFSCTILLKGLCDENRSQEALELLHMMADDRGGGSPPDVVSYTTVINGFFKEGDSDKAYSTYHEMLDRRISPNVVTYSSIIAALCKAQAMDKAMEVLNTMVKNGVMPDCMTYNSILHGYCSSGQPKEAIGTLKKMRSDGVEPNVVTYRSLMNYLCKNGRCTEARKIFDSMTKRGLEPDIATYRTLLQGYATKGALVEMHALLDLMDPEFYKYLEK